MNNIRNCVAAYIDDFTNNLRFFLLDSFFGMRYDIALVPIATQSPQKPAAVYRSHP